VSSLFSWRPAELPDSWAAEHGWTWARVLALLAVAIIAAYAFLESRHGARLSAAAKRLARRILLALLGLSALLAVATFLDFGVFRYGSYINEWDFYHYYVGTKYAPELRYTNLYGATLLADYESGLRYRHPHGEIRDLATARLRNVVDVATEAHRYRGPFTAARWQEFVADIAWFKMQLPQHRWSMVLADHGYNGTPAWSFVVGGLFTRHLSVREPVSRWAMLLLDPLLFLGAVLAVAWAFGTRAALLTVIFVGTHYLFSWGHLKGTLLRTDFAVAALVAVCLVKKARYRSAGVLLGWAILSRVFPVFLLIGPTVLLVAGLWRTHRLDRRLVSLLLTCGLTVALLVIASSAYFGSPAIWHDWQQKISVHYADGSDWDMGLRTIVEATFRDGVPVRGIADALGAGASATPGKYLIESTVFLLLALPALVFVRTLAPHQALAYGFVFVFLFSLATYYYYLILWVPLLYFLDDLEKPQHALGAAVMFLAGCFGYVLFGGWEPLRSWVLFHGWRQTFPTYYFMSCLVGVTVLQMIGLAGWRAWQLERTARRR
jgi:hypothetical protein